MINKEEIEVRREKLVADQTRMIEERIDSELVSRWKGDWVEVWLPGPNQWVDLGEMAKRYEVVWQVELKQDWTDGTAKMRFR